MVILNENRQIRISTKQSVNLLVGLHLDHGGSFDPYLQVYEKILQYNSIKSIRLDASQSDFWEIVSRLDLIIFHWVYVDRDQQMADALIPVIEKEMGKLCFPDWATFWHYNNKIKQFYLLKSHGFPVIESYPIWDRNIADDFVYSCRYPIVFKLNKGALSEDVILVRNRSQAEKIVSLMFSSGIFAGGLPECREISFVERIKKIKARLLRYKTKLCAPERDIRWQKEKGYVFFQKFLTGNKFTTRITIIGNRAFCFNIKIGEGDFRSYDMQRLDFDQNLIDMKAIELAFTISATLKFQCMSYDFLFDENGQPHVCEMGYTAKAYDIYKCPGFWDSSLTWHEANLWPQYCQLVDLLGLDLLQPAIKLDELKWDLRVS